ncbi:MAG: GerMN domain-containing protein [Acidimicrobiia bacterium]|nr:GerMN domain-containing protein [Acidimicrobiia bacterium]
MNRDPFDILRSRNPAPPPSLPEAPMEVARRITAGRPSLRRGLAIAAAAAVAVLVAGGGWLLWSQTGEGHEVVGPATTLPDDDATTSYAMTTTTIVPQAPEVVVYFLKDGALMPVARDLRAVNVLPVPESGRLAMELLLSGPGAWDAGPLPDPVATAEADLTTAVPEGTRVLGVTLADGIVTVDLSAEFAAASPQAISQVVYTLTGPYLEAEEVRFSIEGAPQVVGSVTSGLFTPYLEPADTGSGLESIGRDFLAMYQADVMIENPALGGTLRPGEAVTLVTRGEGATLTLTAADGTLLWDAPAPYGGEPPYLPPEVTEAAGGYGVWATLRAETVGADGAVLAGSEIPVWLEPDIPFTDEPDIPEATTTTATTTSTPGSAGLAPWAAAPLAADTVPALVGQTWAAAEHGDRCAVLYPADPGSLASGAALHERYFGGDWGLAWDLPSGPGRWVPGGDYCADCGREAFGIGGTYFEGLDYTEDAIWSHRLAWTDGSHGGYGYEGLAATGSAGEPLLAYLFLEGRGCLYNVWSYLGEDHLLQLISQLRFVEGLAGSGAAPAADHGDAGLRPFPAETLTGCAAGTARHAAAFETALAGGPVSLEALCAVVGVPDYETGSGLYIPVYDLADGSRLYLGYTAPWGDGLIYARLEMPGGSARDLLEP